MAGVLLILVGPAGAGKTTLAHRLIAASPLTRGFSVSHTTRTMRQGERHGADYFFVDRPAFEGLRDGGQMAETALVHGNYYGTSRAEIARLTGEGRDVMFDIDIAGAHNLWRQYPEKARLVFVLPPSWPVLVQRLRDRGSETEESLRRRLRTARAELQALLQSPADWRVVCNDRLDAALGELEAVLAGAPAERAFKSDPRLLAFVRDAAADPLAD